jgi:DNA-binding SARP family transcriptional activator
MKTGTTIGLMTTTFKAPAVQTSQREAVVLVRVLGRLSIDGLSGPITRARTDELIAYLSLHPRGVSTAQWSEALWPERVMSPATVYSTASAARRALGSHDESWSLLPRARGRLQLDKAVTSDLELLRDAAISEDPLTWWMALDLVRGRPFESLDLASWPVAEGFVAEAEALVADLALRAATRSAGRGEYSLALSAIRTAVLAAPFDERLYRCWMEISHSAGNPAGVESAMQALARSLGVDIAEADALVHEQTWSSYAALRPLSSRSTRGRSGSL